MKLLLAVLLPALAHATCAIAVWTPEKVVLGADSMERVINPSDDGPAVSQCKIHQVGNYYVMFSGIALHRRTGFDTFAILSTSIHQSTSVFEAADLAMNELERGFLKVMISARQDSDAHYLANVEQNSPTFAIADFEGGRAYLVYCSFDKNGTRWTWTRAYYGNSHSDGIAFAYLCGRRGVDFYKHGHPNWLLDDPASTIAGMIEAEARSAPDKVGGPTALVVIDHTGAHWRSGGVCEGQ